MLCWGERCCAGAERGAWGCTHSPPSHRHPLFVTLQPPNARAQCRGLLARRPAVSRRGEGERGAWSPHPSPRSPGDGSAPSWEMAAAHPGVRDISGDILEDGDRPGWLPGQVPVLSPCPWQWLRMETTPGTGVRAPSPGVSRARAPTSGSSHWHVWEEWGRGQDGTSGCPQPPLPPASAPTSAVLCRVPSPKPKPACRAGTSGQSPAATRPRVQAGQAAVPGGCPSAPRPQRGGPGPWGRHGPGARRPCQGAGWGR